VKKWNVNGVSVVLEMGHDDDSDLDLALKTENIPLGLTPGGVVGGAGTIGGFGISVKESSQADTVVYWPAVSIQNPDRRDIINRAAVEALEEAEEQDLKSVGFFTMGFEVSRVPSWEVADALVKAVVNHLKENSSLQTILLVASSPMQLSSLEFALNNHWSLDA
jgi:O-acetyl-ADP-ribose deacetylase (regulator of RNase III)